jgi:hypothetical protein
MPRPPKLLRDESNSTLERKVLFSQERAGRYAGEELRYLRGESKNAPDLLSAIQDAFGLLLREVSDARLELRNLDGSPEAVERIRRFLSAVSFNANVYVSAIDRARRGTDRPMRRNPPLAIFGNPKGGKLMSRNVLAIAYIHEEDGEPYVHGFGDAPIKLKTGRDGTVTIKGLVDKTDVGMSAQADGSVRVFGLNGQEVWSDREPE